MTKYFLEEAKIWAENPYFDPQDRAEIQALLSNPSDEKELFERFYQNLEFGTGGLRSIIGVGQNRINKYTIRKATTALALNMKKNFKQPLKAVVSFDPRKFSREFAEEAAQVFAAHEITTYLYPELTPTPMLSFAIRKLGAHGGVMITASHNPPKYNGYKAFWADGGQVVPPYDAAIIKTYNELKNWNEIKTLPSEKAQNWIKIVPPEIDEAFYQMIENKVIVQKKMCLEFGEKLKVVYTPLHGTGKVPCEMITRRLGFKNFKTLASQAKPDANFSTVKFPNPEDPEALAMAVEEMKKTHSHLVMGTDPDCDRLGVICLHEGVDHVINGNQIGALFLDYIFKIKKELGTLPKNSLVIKTIVTSSIQDAIVNHYGGTVKNTLTGFKWMADLIRTLEEQKSPLEFVFASEESFGYMPHKESRDKDGVSSVALMCEVALYHLLHKKTLIDALNDIYEKFGYFDEALVAKDYEGVEGAKKIKSIMDHFRKWPSSSMIGEKILKIEDYLKNDLTGLPASNVLGFHFDNGDKLFLRPSGTEPKIKFYIMTQSTSGTLTEKKKASREKIQKFKEVIEKECHTL
jgi:phosphoglucomutase